MKKSLSRSRRKRLRKTFGEPFQQHFQIIALYYLQKDRDVYFRSLNHVITSRADIYIYNYRGRQKHINHKPFRYYLKFSVSAFFVFYRYMLWYFLWRQGQNLEAISFHFRSELFTSYILTIFKQWNLLIPLIWETAKYSYSCM